MTKTKSCVGKGKMAKQFLSIIAVALFLTAWVSEAHSDTLENFIRESIGQRYSGALGFEGDFRIKIAEPASCGEDFGFLRPASDAFAASTVPPSPADGNVVEFDGVDDYAIRNHSSALEIYQPGQSPTIETWARFKSLPSASSGSKIVIIIDKPELSLFVMLGEVAEPFSAAIAYMFPVEEQGGVVFWLVFVRLNLPVDEWIHIAVCNRISQGNILIAINGEAHVWQDFYTARVSSDYPMVMGGPDPAAGYGEEVVGLHGYLDEVRISTTPRYSGDFNPNGAFVSDSSTVALYHFDEDPGSTSFADASKRAGTAYGRNGAKIAGSPPPIPTKIGPVENLSSESHEINKWSGNNQIQASWDPSPDVGSGLAGYSIVWDNDPDTTPDTTKDIDPENQTVSPKLGSHASHYFHIRPVDTEGNAAEPTDVRHLGPFKIDVDPPLSVTDLKSSTHAEREWSTEQVVKATWGPASDAHSGLDGYSALWDRNANTSPEHTKNRTEGVTEDESPTLTTGDDHYFHISAVDKVNNWENTKHLGPFFIDVDKPPIVTNLTSTTHTVAVCSSDPVVRLSWKHALDVGSGINGYSVVWDTEPGTLPGNTQNVDGTGTESPNLADGNSHYCHIRSVDKVGNWSDEAAHIGPFYINSIGPEPVDLWSDSHEVDKWSNDDTVVVRWTPVEDECSNIDGYSIVWDTQPDTLPDNVKDIKGNVTTAASPPLTGKGHHFHIRGLDDLGNWGNEAAHLGPFLIDVTKPSEVADLQSTTHSISTWSSTRTVEVAWSPAQDKESGIAGYSIVWDTSPDTLPDKTIDTDSGSGVLSDGNSYYFHIRSADNAGNWCDTAAHLGPFWIDGTPPTLVTNLSSPSHTIQTCSVTTAVKLTWTAATDASSGLQGYSVLWDTSPNTLPDDTVELGSGVTEHASAALADGNSHYCHIRSIDNVGNASKAVHIGPFYIDTTGPELVTNLESASHQVDTWSNNDTVDAQWTSAVDVCSGVDGYSIVWDEQPNTLPDEVKDIEGNVTTATSPSLAGNGHYFHIRGLDTSGNWSGEAAHLGPFLIDVTKPSEVANLQSSSHTQSTWSSTQVVKAAWTPAQDSESGLTGYSVIWDTSPDTLPDETIDLGANVTEAESGTLASGNSHYFHIRSADNAGNWCDTAVHLGPFWIDGAPPTLVTNLSSPSHLIKTCSKDTVVKLTWTAAQDDGSGLAGYSVVWDTSPNTLPDNTVELGSGVTEHASAELPDGISHYCHIRSIDNAGNPSNEAAHIGPFYIDITGPEPVTNLQSTSHQVDKWSNDDTVDVLWTPAVDECGDVGGYSIVWDEQPDTLPDEVKDIEGNVTTATSPPLAGNGHYFHIRGVDTSGNWSDEAMHLGPFLIDVVCPSLSIPDVASPTHAVGECSSGQVVKVAWTPAQDDGSGLAGYSVVWDTKPDTLPDETVELDPDVTETESPVLPDGNSHYLHIRSVDNVDNWCDTAVHVGPFVIDTTAPTLTLSSSSHKVSSCSNVNIVVVKVNAKDNLCGVRGFSVVWDGILDTEPLEIQNVEASETIESPELAPGEWYVHVKSVDNAGNWSDSAHLGPFLVDATEPSEVTGLVSTTHDPGIWSSVQRVKVEWIRAQDDGCGLAGYSVAWDTSPDTLPDKTVELGLDVTSSESAKLADGDSHYYHIRSVDVAGNWCSTAAHIGPFQIDANPPGPVRDLVCTSHALGEWSNSDVLKFTWTPAVDMGSGLDGYAVVIDKTASTIPDVRNLDDTAAAFSSARLDDGKHYFHIRPVDKMGFWGKTTHAGPFRIDTTPPPPPRDLSSPPHVMGVWLNQRTARVSWQRVTDEASGLQGYSISWDAAPDEVADLSSAKTSISQDLADGTHTFHIRAVDKAGNWSEVGDLGEFRIDTLPPHSVRIQRITEDSGEEYMHVKDTTLYYSAIGAGEFTVYVSGTDDVSGLKEAKFADCVSSGGTVPVVAGEFSHQYRISSSSAFDGWVDIEVYDNAGNSAITSFNLSYDSAGPYTPVNVKCDDGAEWNNTGEVKVTWQGEGDDRAGVADYYVEANNDKPETNPSSGSTMIPAEDGKSIIFYMRGLDNVGNWGKAANAAIGVDTEPPGGVQKITHTDLDSNPGYDTDGQLDFSWQPATDNIEVDHYDVYLSVDGGGYELQESLEEESYKVAGVDGRSYKLKVTAVDPAGNEGPATESEEIVCDMTPPEFIVGMFRNPGFHNFMDIAIVSLEEILENSPDLSVNLMGNKSVKLKKIVENVWVGNYTIPLRASGTATLTVSGTDLAGNETVNKDYSFSAQSVSPAAPAHIQSADDKLVLDIPAGAFDRDTMVTITPVVSNEMLIQGLGSVLLAPGMTTDAIEPNELKSTGQGYVISPNTTRLLSKGTLTMRYDDALEESARAHLGIYLWDSDTSEWEYVGSSVDDKTRSVSASVDRFGTFGLYSDTKAPQISQISPPDGVVLDTSLPEFVVKVTDNGSGVDFSSLSLLIDGQIVSANRKQRDGFAVLTPEHSLTEGDHTFSIVGEDLAGNIFTSVGRGIHIPAWAVVPELSQLLQNYPNPFNPETWIPYRLSESAHVRLSIYGVSGRLIRTLDMGAQKPGTYTSRERAIYWDGRNDNGEAVSSGIYFYQLWAGEFDSVRKMVIAR